MSNTTIPQDIIDRINKQPFTLNYTDKAANHFIDGGFFGYSLAQSELEKLKAENLKLANELADAKAENESLQFLIQAAFDHAMKNRFSRYPEKVWKQFCAKNNIKPLF